MENTIENKRKFFAQYWGQEVFSFGFYKHKIDCTVNLAHKDGFLELTPISMISDKDLLKCAELFGFEYPELKNALLFKSQIEKWSYEHRGISDYLRSKGYAVKYQDLEVSQQIEYGWIKLKTK